MILDRRNCCVCAGKGIQKRALILTPQKRIPLCPEDAHKFWLHMDEDIVCREAPKVRSRREAADSRAGVYMRQWSMESVRGKRQRSVYEAIKNYASENGELPRVTDVAIKVGISPGNVGMAVARMEAHGFVVRVGKKIQAVNRIEQV